MVTLRVLPDRMLEDRPSGGRRYARNLSELVIARAPAGCDVEAIVPKAAPEELERVEGELPGLTSITQLGKRRDSLANSWRRGFSLGRAGGGFIHSMSLLAPIRDISMSYGIDQTVVTVHDASATRRPELRTPGEVTFEQAMMRRAYRFASAIVAPTNAVADELSLQYDFGDRLRVIGGAADRRIALPDTEDEGDRIAERIGLPDEYVLTFATAAPRKGLAPLLAALARPELAGVTLVIVGPTSVGDGKNEQTSEALVAASGVDARRVRMLGVISDTAVAVALQRASALVVPTLEAGFGLPLVEAFQFGTPVIASDAPAHLEVGMDAVRVVERAGAAGGSSGAGASAGAGSGAGASAYAEYGERLEAGIAEVLRDTDLSRRLRVAGRDRAGVYHWGMSADQVWELHADV
ncbi:MAG: glycosyltransferase family 4 protein [Pseudoclavibacter sp.]